MLLMDSHNDVNLDRVPNRQTRWAHQEITPRPDLLNYSDFKPGFIFYTQHHVEELNSEQGLKIRLAGTTSGQSHFVGFTRQSNWDELPSEVRAGPSILLQEGEYIVFADSSRSRNGRGDRVGLKQ